MDFSKVKGFGEVKDDIEYNGFFDWLVAYKSVGDAWREQPSYLYVQAVISIGSLVSLFHAVKNGGRFLHLWIGITLHGLVVEMIAYNLPDVDNFWHSQTPITFLGRRLPLYIILLYTAFLYPATIAVNKLNLPRWSEPFAVGLVTVLIDHPYDVIGARFVHWTWHDTDPNISDKYYHVPWNSFYFHATFAASFTFWFHLTRYITFGRTKKWLSDRSFLKECMCTVIAALFGMPGGVLLFIPLYHSLHDVYNIHSSVTFLLLFSIFFGIIWLGLPRNVQTDMKNSNFAFDRLILLHLVLYYIFFISVATFMDPAAEVSIGFHEPVGPCNETVPMTSALGHTLYKRKYLCITDNDETYFGWSCLSKKQLPKDGAKWYTICGTQFTDRLEYILVLTAAGIFGISFFIKALGLNCTNKNLKDDHMSLKQKKKI